MAIETPVVNYKTISINGKSVTLSGTCRASFTSPYNKIDITMQPTNSSLSYFEVRVTKDDEDWDIGVGKCAYWTANVAANTDTSFSIDINETNFSSGDGTYRISLYAKSAVDGSWDVTCLFFTVDDEKWVPTDANGMEVLTTEDAPVHEE